MRKKIICWLSCLLLASGAVEAVHAQGTAFTYQGRLNDGGAPANGTYDLTFSLYPTNQTGALAAVPITNLAMAVSSGLFTTTLDFGPGLFKGRDYWLEIAVRTNGAVSFTNLAPRQPLLPVPYAIYANSTSNLLGTLPASAFVGYTNTVTLTNSGNLFGGTFSGNGTNLVNLNASQLTGGTVADARLSPNVALLNGNQTFTGANTFTNLYGNSFAGTFFGNGLVGWIPTNATTFQAQIDHGYLLTNSQLVSILLPPTPVIGDIVRISGAGTGGWQVVQGTNQSIIGSFSSFANSSWTKASAGGTTWTAIAGSNDGTKWVATANSGSGSVYTSTDSGQTWSPTGPVSGQWQAVASSANGIKLVAAINGGNIYTSTNSGSSWVVRTSVVKNWASLASSDDGVRLVAVVNGENIYYSPDSGVNWAATSSGGSKTWYSVASSANGSNWVAVVNTGSGRGVWTNSGTSWTQTGAPAKSWTSVASSADGHYLTAAEAGGTIYGSVNSGSTWQQLSNAPSLIWASIASSADGSKLTAASQGGGIYNSINYGATWIPQAGTTNLAWSCIGSSADGSKLVAGVNPSGGIYYAQVSLQPKTTTGTNGFISGVQGSAVELQYIGNNQFMPVSSAGAIWAN